MTQKTEDGVVTNYIYGIEDRLTEVRDESGSLIVEYYYDPFGRRLWKDVGGTKTYFLYADEGLVGEYDESGTEIKTYGYVPGSTWTTDPIFMKINSNYYFYHNDHLGTPQKMTAINGAVVWSAKYESFGKAEVDITSTITNNIRFPGQHEDQETGLHYNYQRYYDPVLGRYMKADPVGFGGGINYHIYAMNNPLRILDPYGLNAITDIISIIPIVGTFYNLFSNPPGSNITDYKIIIDCDHVIPIEQCKKNVMLQASSYYAKYLGLTFAHDLIDVIAAAATPFTIVFIIDAAADTAITFYKIGKIGKAAKEAAKLCVTECHKKCEGNNE